MRFAATKEGESLDELVTRVYAFTKKPTKAEVSAAGKELARANPFLRRPADVPDGTLVVVPTIDGAEPSGATNVFEAEATATLADQLRTIVANAGDIIEGDVDRDVEETRAAIALLQSSDVKRHVRAEGMVAEARDAEAAAKDRIAAAKELKHYRSEAFQRIEEDLDELLRTLKRT